MTASIFVEEDEDEFDAAPSPADDVPVQAPEPATTAPCMTPVPMC